MNDEQWKEMSFFNKEENWGSPESMDYRLLWLLDNIRKEIGKAFIVHCGFETSGHSQKSFHKEGMAVDLHVRGIGLYTAWELLDKMWWIGGVGIYPYWNKPGFHLDIGPRRRWCKNKDGNYFKIVNGVFEWKMIDG